MKLYLHKKQLHFGNNYYSIYSENSDIHNLLFELDHFMYRAAGITIISMEEL